MKVNDILKESYVSIKEDDDAIRNYIGRLSDKDVLDIAIDYLFEHYDNIGNVLSDDVIVSRWGSMESFVKQFGQDTADVGHEPYYVEGSKERNAPLIPDSKKSEFNELIEQGVELEEALEMVNAITFEEFINSDKFLNDVLMDKAQEALEKETRF